MILGTMLCKRDLLSGVLGAGVSALILAGLSMTSLQQVAAVPTVLEAQSFVVEDANGKTRAILGVEKDGGVVLKLLGAPKSRAVATMGATRDGQPFVVMQSPSSKGKVWIGVEDDMPRILMFDGQGKKRFTCRVDDKDGVTLAIANRKEAEILKCSVSSRGQCSLEVRDAFGGIIKKFGD